MTGEPIEEREDENECRDPAEEKDGAVDPVVEVEAEGACTLPLTIGTEVGPIRRDSNRVGVRGM